MFLTSAMDDLLIDLIFHCVELDWIGLMFVIYIHRCYHGVESWIVLVLLGMPSPTRLRFSFVEVCI